jgi:Mrp family chromosome partitioning ATPase
MSASLIAGSAHCCTNVEEFASVKSTPVQSGLEWSTETFAREQIYRLARSVFCSAAVPPVRQVIFATAGPDVEVYDLSRKVAQVLAEAGLGQVALLSADRDLPPAACKLPLAQLAHQLATNLWSLEVPESKIDSQGVERIATYMRAIRAEFDYSIVTARAGSKSEASDQIAQLADGVVLVLSAQKTRRAAALKIKQALDDTRVRLLGTVLMDREFPIPDRLYRQL